MSFMPRRERNDAIEQTAEDHSTGDDESIDPLVSELCEGGINVTFADDVHHHRFQASRMLRERKRIQ